MAELAEYQQWLRNGIKAGAAGDPNQKYLAHLAQYDENSPFYGGSMQFTNELQYRANGQSNGLDIGQSLKLILGSDVDVDGLARKAAQVQRDIDVDTTDRAGYYYDSQEAVNAARTAPLDPREIQDAKERLLSGSPWLANIDPNKTYAWTTSNNNSGQYGGSRLVEVSHDFDPSKFSGSEIIRPGELDNFVNNVKDMYGGQFDQAWNTQIEPSLRKSGAKGDLSSVRDKARANFMDKQIPWQNLLKYDPNVGLMASYGSVKHVNDEGGGWEKYMGAWVKAAFATALAAITGGALAPAASAFVGGATGSATAATAASVASKALLSSAINAGLNRQKLTGKNLLIGAVSSGVGSGVGNLVANATGTATTGLPALLASGATRSLISNKGKIDPRLLALNTAGAYADGLMGQPVYSLGKTAYGAYNNYNRLQSNNGQARRPVMMQGRSGALLRSGVKPNG